MNKITIITILLLTSIFLWFSFSRHPKLNTLPPIPLINNLILSPTPYPVVSNRKPLQYVILSFDGSESLAMWEATRNFAKTMNLENKPIHFTYFVSGVYFLSPENRNKYLPPHQSPGTSRIGFSHSVQDVIKRITEMNLAISEDHEIASHLNGHWDGSQWTQSDWKSEIDQFKSFVPLSTITGMRAPLLSRNENLYKVIPQEGFIYDSSGVGKMGDWPKKNKFGTWEIPLVSITIPEINKSTLSMDYNEYLTQTNGKDILRRGTSAWNNAFRQIVMADENYFNFNYQGNRAPVIIGNHFSVWNDGLYWESMKAFAQNVCGKIDVRCTTFSSLVKYLETKK